MPCQKSTSGKECSTKFLGKCCFGFKSKVSVSFRRSVYFEKGGEGKFIFNSTYVRKAFLFNYGA